MRAMRDVCPRIVIGLALLLGAGCGGDDSGDGGVVLVDVPVAWDYGPGAVTLSARNFALALRDTSTPTLHSNADATVTGSGFTVGHDAGTLEITWSERGNEMRLYFYFAKGDAGWHVTNVQHHDGKSPPGWVFYTGPLWQTPNGQPFTGDVELLPDTGQPDAELRFDGLSVTAFGVELPAP